APGPQAGPPGPPGGRQGTGPPGRAPGIGSPSIRSFGLGLHSGHRVIWQGKWAPSSTEYDRGHVGQTLDRLTGQRASGFNQAHQVIWASDSEHTRHSGNGKWALRVKLRMNRGHRGSH
ncbi:unnamed protein product, partial [Staurois parvus]